MEEEKLMTVREHLSELKSRFIHIVIAVIFLFLIGFMLSEEIILFLIDHFGLELVVLSPLEFIHTQIKISFFFTIALLIPFILVNLYLFSKPVLKNNFKKEATFNFISSCILATIGFFFGVFIFSDFTLSYFSQLPEGLKAFWGVYESISFIAMNGFVFALMTQLIIIIPLLVKLDLVSIDIFKKSRKAVIVSSLILSAILTSPDAVTQVMMAAPMYFCLETGIFISKIENKKKKIKN